MSEHHSDAGASMFAQAAYNHDLGLHDNSDAPMPYCPRCEMVHPRGKYRVAMDALERLARAAEIVVTAIDNEASNDHLRMIAEDIMPAPTHGARRVLEGAVDRRRHART